MGQGVNWEALDRQRANNGMGEKIISAVLQAAMDKKANQDNLGIQKQLLEEKGKQELAQAIELQKIKSQYDPDMMLIDKLTGAGSQPTGGVLGQGSEVSQPGFKLDNNQLLRGIVSKKFGVPFEQMMSPEEQSLEAQRMQNTNPTLIKAKNEDTKDVIDALNQNELKRGLIGQAQEATKKIPTGLGGKMSMWWNKMFDPENPQMGEWQKVKMVLTDAQLMNTAKTKGAISDKEMELFSKAAANDDIASIAAMQPVFEKLLKFIDMEESSKITSFKKIYGEDPTTWGVGRFKGVGTTPNINQDFKSEDEALASGIKGIVIINGRKARID